MDTVTGHPLPPANPLLSLVVPVYNEAAAVGPFVARVRLAMQALPACRFEIVFVDDGSVDANRACLEAKRRPVYVVDEVYEPRADI